MLDEESSEIQSVISGDAAFLERLRADGFRGGVHSVFRQVVNIEDGHGELHTLACRRCDDAPNTLRLAADELDADWFVAGDPCFSLPEKSLLCFSSGMHVRYSQALPWECRLPAYPARLSNLPGKIVRMERALKAEAASPSAGAGRYQQAVEAMLREKAERLLHLLLHDDLPGATECAVGMIGLGPGLTPSGDDFLTGLFAVLNIEGSPARRLRRICGDILERATPLTHPISLAALKTSAQGRVRQSIVDLLDNLFDEDAPLDDAVLSRVMRIGSTSGRDILAGVLCGARLDDALAARGKRGLPAG